MAGPRFLGINNVINPYDDARRAVQEAGSIYMAFNDQARRDEEASRQREDHTRQRKERETLAGYTPTVGDNFFGIDADTQNYIRQNEELVTRQNDEALARKDPKALSREQLQKSFMDTRARLADRGTVFGSVVNDLVSQGVTLENAQLRANQIASAYGSTADLSAAEQARVKATNDAEDKRIGRVLDLYKTEANNRAQIIKGFSPRSTSTSSGSSKAGKAVTSTSGLPSIEDQNKQLEAASEMLGSGDAERGLGDFRPAYQQLRADIRARDEQRRQEAIAAGIDPKTIRATPMISWDDALAEYVLTAQTGGSLTNNRFGVTGVGNIRERVLNPAQQALEMQSEMTGATGTNGAGGRTGTAASIGIDEALRYGGAVPQGVLEAISRNPSVARSLTDLNKDRVASAYSQFMRANPQASTTLSAGATTARPPQTTPVDRPVRNVTQEQSQTVAPSRLGTANNAPITTGTTGPSIVNNFNAGPRVSNGNLAEPNVQGLAPEVARFVQSATQELTRLYTSANNATPERREQLSARIDQLEAGLREAGGLDRVAAVLNNNLPILEAREADTNRTRELFQEYRELTRAANSTGSLLTPRNQVATDQSLARLRLQRFIQANPQVVEQYENEQATARQNLRDTLNNTLQNRSYSSRFGQ